MALQFAHTDTEQRRLAALARAGQLRRVAPKVYLAADDPDEAIARNLPSIVEFLYPGWVVAYRCALTLLPDNGVFYLVGPVTTANTRELGPITLRLLPGNTTRGVQQCLPRLKCMRPARVVLESAASRTRGPGKHKYLTPSEIEALLVKQLDQDRGNDARLNGFRDELRSLAQTDEERAAVTALDAQIGALLSTRPADGVLHSAAALAYARRAPPFDQRCLERCQRLIDYLLPRSRELDAPPYPYSPFEKQAWRNLSFIEAYFSNYIEGTEMTVEEAEQVVFKGVPLANRAGDSHDVSGYFSICSDYEEMGYAPETPEAFLRTLQSRHAVLLRGRPEKGPGQLKIARNQAGNVLFVDPAQVESTLAHGFELVAQMPRGFSRAVYLHFLVTDVHPMADGNGRLARVMMNSELVAAGQVKLIVPTVARDDYLNGQRLSTRESDFRTMTKTLWQLHKYTAALPLRAYDELLERLEKDSAFSLPDEGIGTFNRARRQYRYEDGPVPVVVRPEDAS